MKRVGALLLAILINLILFVPAFANPDSSIVISEFMVASSSSASSEFIELYNPLNTLVNVTDWKIQYQSASANPETGSWTTRATLDGGLQSKSFLLASSSVFDTEQSIVGDEALTAGMAATGGKIRVIDNSGMTLDSVSYGASTIATEGSPASTPAAGHSLKRITNDDALFLDTNNNSQDFIVSNSPFAQGGGVEEIEPIDVCPNLADDQAVVPDGYELDGGQCILINTPDPDPPSYLPLIITELLPNAEGADEDNEFIEIYNPHDQPVGLAGYKLHVGQNFEKAISLPDNLEISPKQYLTFYNSGFNFTLLNSSSRARLTDPNNTSVSETESYQDPGDGVAWAKFDDGWKMTQEATPDAENVYLWVEVSETDTSLEPCPVGKFRNPETNRCKNIDDGSGLKPCAPDQVRNPETNRCRRVASASSSLTPCKPGQERNPETNRCRKIGSDDGLKPCQPGYERNPETNRCRKASSSAVGALASPAAINPVKLNSQIIAVLVALATGYAAYEYRSDVSRFLQRLRDKRGDPRPPG